jgi:tetratricopeptide (TPR) repeat protein
MSDKEHIKALAREAEVYRSQGLLSGAKQKYQEILQFVQAHGLYSKDKKLIETVNNKIKAIEENLSEVLEAPERPEVKEDVQNLIQKLFSFSKDQQTSRMEGAVALAKFGQYEKALNEFKKLLKEGILPLDAAKNILRCHLTLSSPDVAVYQFKRWLSRGDFSAGDLKYLRGFLQKYLEKRGIQTALPEVVETPQEKGETKKKKKKKAKKKEEEVLDISSVGVQFQNGPLKGRLEEFEVTFQAGNTISIIIPSDRKDLLESFEPGLRLKEMQCYSLIAVFNGSGIVSNKSVISSGPKRGHYTLDITIDGG